MNSGPLVAYSCGAVAKNVGAKTSGRGEHLADRRAGRITPLRLMGRAIRSVAAISLCGRAVAYGSAVNDGDGQRFSGAA